MKNYIFRKIQCGDIKHLFVRMEDYDYGIRFEGESVSMWCGDLVDMFDQDEIQSAVKASVDEIKAWYDHIYGTGMQETVCTAISRVLYIMRNKTGRKLYLYNLNTGMNLSCWKNMRSIDENIDLRIKDCIIEMTVEGISRDSCARLVHVLNDAQDHDGAPFESWNWLMEKSHKDNYAIVRVFNHVSHCISVCVLYVRDENGNEPSQVTFLKNRRDICDEIVRKVERRVAC